MGRWRDCTPRRARARVARRLRPTPRAPEASPAHAGADPDAVGPGGTLRSVTSEAEAAPVIEREADAYNASLVRRVDEGESLASFWVRFDGEPTPFEPGQYMTIGVKVGEQMVQRPYSVASPPAIAGSEGYEFYVRRVQGGTFTPLLFELPVGHRMRMIGPKGKFMLAPDDDRTHIFISSGTGNAPFVSMMRQLLIDGAPRPVVFLNGVSYANELGYKERLEGWERSGEYPVQFVPTVSRPERPVERRLDGAYGPGRDDPGAGPRGARADAGELDRLHLRQPGHDPLGGGDAPRPRLPRGPGPQGAVLAQGQGAAGDGGVRPRDGDRDGRGERGPVAPAGRGTPGT